MKKLAFLTSLLFAVLIGSAQSSTYQSTSSGFFISSQGYIVTNYHAVERATAISVTCTLPGQTLTWKAEVVVEDPKTDLAILKITDRTYVPLPPVPYSFRNGTADVGESIFVLGYPLTTSMGKEVKLTDGIISSKTGVVGDVTLYQVSASVQPGNSGGPLFDKNGNIVGVVKARHKDAENATYAVKIAYLLGMLDLLPDQVLLPATNQLNGKSLPEQVKLASKYVCLLEVTHEDESASDEQDERFQKAMELLEEAEEAMEKKNFSLAFSRIDQSLKLVPQNTDAFMLRGFMRLYHLDAFKEAVQDFNQVIALESDYSVAFFHRGYANWKLDRQQEALRDFNHTLALNEDDVDAYFMRGLILSNEGLCEDALGDFSAIIQREKTADPFVFKMEYVYFQKALCLVELERNAEALPLLNKTLLMEKENPLFWYTRGRVNFNLEDYSNCVKDMTKALDSEEDAIAYFYRGLSYMQLEKMPEGCTDLRRSAELGDEDAAKIVAEFCDGVKPVTRPPSSGSTQASRPAPPPAPVYPETLFATSFKTTTKRAGVLWGQPSHDGKYLQNIAAQINVEAIGYSNGFWKVRVNGRIGYLDDQTIYITFGMRDAIAK